MNRFLSKHRQTALLLLIFGTLFFVTGAYKGISEAMQEYPLSAPSPFHP